MYRQQPVQPLLQKNQQQSEQQHKQKKLNLTQTNTFQPNNNLNIATKTVLNSIPQQNNSIPLTFISNRLIFHKITK
jgi:hypothetical protein